MSRGSFKISLKGEVWRWCPVLYIVTVSHHSCSKGAIAGLPGAPADPCFRGEAWAGWSPSLMPRHTWRASERAQLNHRGRLAPVPTSWQRPCREMFVACFLPPLESWELTMCKVLTPGKPWSSTLRAKQQVSYSSDSECLLHSWSMEFGVDFSWD